MNRELQTGRVKCFGHPLRDSVGFCAVCSRALCHECGTSVGPTAFTCKGKHERQMRRLRLRASVLRTGSWGARSLFSSFAVAVALLFVIWGSLSRPFSLYRPLLGLAFLALTLVLIVRNKGANDKSDR
jgi:hypothetical protein